MTDEDAFKTAKDFAAQEGVLIGISSGAAVFAALELAKKVGKGKKNSCYCSRWRRKIYINGFI